MTKLAETADVVMRLEEFLRDVQAGDEVVITREQKPVARLVPVEPEAKRGLRSIRDLKPLEGEWVGERVIRSGDLAEEMFRRE